MNPSIPAAIAHLRRPATAIPAVILLSWALLAVSVDFLPLSPNTIDLPKVLLGPSAEAWLGYDDVGRSVAHRLLAGARTSFLVALFVVTISSVLGTAIGVVSWSGGWTDTAIVRLIDVFLAFPGILLAIALAGILGPGLRNVVLALAVTGWVGYARLARAQTLAVKERDHVQAALSLGTREMSILVRHILPLVSAPLIVEATFGVAGTILSEAGLSFLGLGVQPPAPSWGSMIRDGTRYMLMAPHLVIAPGLAMALVVISVNLLGDRLRDAWDVRSRNPAIN
jgi:peptide/nickel transport system permease protein